MVKEFAARRDLLVRLIAETPLLKANTPEGAFYVMLNISGVLGKRYQGAEITGSDSFAEMLINAKQVAVVPGKAFGADDHVRMSYAISRENIRRIRIRIGIGHPGFFRFPIHGPPHFPVRRPITIAGGIHARVL